MTEVTRDISIWQELEFDFLYPYPLQAGQAPLSELKLKCELLNPRYFASLVPAYKSLILSKTFTKVAGQLLGVFPMLDWST